MIITATYWNGCRVVTDTYKCVGYVDPKKLKRGHGPFILGKDIIVLNARKVK